jgi:hypothetical protein
MRLIYSFLLLLCVTLVPFGATAQLDMPKTDSAGPEITSSAQAAAIQQTVWQIARDVLSISGLEPTFKVRADADTHNAAALLDGEERILSYNARWIQRFYTDAASEREVWSLYTVIAHEIGHHLQGHTLVRGGSRPATELEADAYAGFVLAGLGATLAQSQYLFEDFDEEGSDTHPSRAARMAAVEEGRALFFRRGLTVSDRLAALSPAPPMPQAPLRRAPDPAATAMAQPRPPATDDTSRKRPASLKEVCASTPTGRICAASEQADHGVAVLTDVDNIRLPWIETENSGDAERYLAFDYDTPTTLRRLRLINGHNETESLWTRHARAEALTLTGSNGHTRKIIVRDRRDLQDWTLVGFEDVDWIHIRVDSVIAGRRYGTLALSVLVLD